MHEFNLGIVWLLAYNSENKTDELRFYDILELPDVFFGWLFFFISLKLSFLTLES